MYHRAQRVHPAAAPQIKKPLHPLPGKEAFLLVIPNLFQVLVYSVIPAEAGISSLIMYPAS
jgi:hypothetical protein